MPCQAKALHSSASIPLPRKSGSCTQSQHESFARGAAKAHNQLGDLNTPAQGQQTVSGTIPTSGNPYTNAETHSDTNDPSAVVMETSCGSSGGAGFNAASD